MRAGKDQCASTGLSLLYEAGGRRALKGPAPHVVRYADHGVELCDAVDRAPRVPADCALPPTDPAETFLTVRRTASGRFLSGVVPAEIAAARVTLADRTTTTIPARPLTGYAGIYAGVLREIAADLPGPHAIRQVELLDDHGRVLMPEAGTEAAYGPAVTVLPAAHGLPAVHAAPLTTGRFAATCLVLGPFDDCDHGQLFATADARSVSVTASCTPHRLVVSAILAHRDDRLVVRTTGGRELPARMARLPSGAGALAGKYYALAVAGPHDGIASVAVRGRAPRRFQVDLPPAGRQCGYSAAPDLLAGRLD
jgi:hypothetical protein